MKKVSSFKRYVAPVAEDLQHEVFEHSVSVHTDITLLQNIDKMRISNQTAELIKARFKEVASQELSPDVQSALDKVDDFKLQDFTPSRYAQTLSDRQQYFKDTLKKYNDEVQSLKDKEEKAKRSARLESLEHYIDVLSSN